MFLVFVVQLMCTMFMTGLIWFVQIVHYPLFQSVLPSAPDTRYHADHVRRTTWVVMPVMLIELVTAFAGCIWPTIGISPPVAWIGLLLLAVIWFSTALIQVPCHDLLARGWNPEVHHRLVASNWVRTVSWSARSVLLMAAFVDSSR